MPSLRECYDGKAIVPLLRSGKANIALLGTCEGSTMQMTITPYCCSFVRANTTYNTKANHNII